MVYKFCVVVINVCGRGFFSDVLVFKICLLGNLIINVFLKIDCYGF